MLNRFSPRRDTPGAWTNAVHAGRVKVCNQQIGELTTFDVERYIGRACRIVRQTSKYGLRDDRTECQDADAKRQYDERRDREAVG